MFEFAWPWIFVLLPLPWVMRLLLPIADSGEPALNVSYLEDLEGLARRRARINLPGWRQQAPFVVLWLLLLTAAARPEWLGEPLPIAASGRDLLVAVDVSGSMDFPDMHWQDEDVSRLTLVKHLLGDFLQGREGDRVGLILFGSQAYLQAPLTFDRRTVRTWLDEARIGIAGKNTAIGDAIGLALKRLRQRPAQSRVLILVTDGANNGGQIDPLTAARLAAEEGVKIYPIGIGADPEQTGATGGRYFRARDGEELQQVKDTLDQLEPVEQQPTQARPAQALYSGPLALALILSMLLVIHERWPDNALQRLLNKLPRRGMFLPQRPEWRQRLKRLRLRRRR
ncbi:BatB protein [Pseudomonas sp. ABAC21]|nr:BatB protein [Pseudomonas sp. ABAC21]